MLWMDFVAAEVILTEVWGWDTCLWDHRWTYQLRTDWGGIGDATSAHREVLWLRYWKLRNYARKLLRLVEILWDLCGEVSPGKTWKWCVAVITQARVQIDCLYNKLPGALNNREADRAAVLQVDRTQWWRGNSADMSPTIITIKTVESAHHCTSPISVSIWCVLAIG